MLTPGYLPLGADRHTPCFRTLELLPIDLTGGAFSMQVRAQKEAAGAALIDLTATASTTANGVRLVYGGTDTIANHIAAGRLTAAPQGYSTGDSLALSLLSIQIAQTTIEALASAVRPEDDLYLEWDIHITPSGGNKERWLYGEFVIRAGVTR